LRNTALGIVVIGGPAKALLDFSHRGFRREASAEEFIYAGDRPVAAAAFSDDEYVTVFLANEFLEVLKAGPTRQQWRIKVRDHGYSEEPSFTVD